MHESHTSNFCSWPKYCCATEYRGKCSVWIPPMQNAADTVELCKIFADTAHASICLEGLFWVSTEMHLPVVDILHAACDVPMGPHLAYTFAAATPRCLQHDRIPYSLAANKRLLHIVYASLQRGDTQKNINGIAQGFFYTMQPGQKQNDGAPISRQNQKDSSAT